MEPYTKESLPAAGGYRPTPSQPVRTRRLRNLATLFRTSRRFRYLICAAIVVVGAVAVPTVSHLLARPQPQVLEAARTLAAGHVIAAGDLVAATGRQQGASLIPVAEEPALIGRQLKIEVPSGALVAPVDFGPFPPTGMSVVPVAVKPGQYSPTLQGGDQVAIFPLPGAAGAGTAQPAAHAAATARVLQLQQGTDSSNTVVVLLETTTAMAPVIAQAPGVVLVTLDAQADAP